MTIDLIGWDIGGAHLKAAALVRGEVVAVMQRACPLWRGLTHLHAAVAAILGELPTSAACIHAITMTGELVDGFVDREEGVMSLLRAMSTHCHPERLLVFAGPLGFLPATAVDACHVATIASANWLATGLYLASRVPSALLLDIGSTTTDLLILSGGKVHTLGFTDHERLTRGELVYTGVVRTSLMAVAQAAPFAGEWVGLMAEHFATTGDVYRLTGELPAHADQAETADGGAKTPQASARRLARLLGLDWKAVDSPKWQAVAHYFRQCQLSHLELALARQLSRGLLAAEAPLVGAGVGRFLVQELARRFGRPYLDCDDVFPTAKMRAGFHPADCAPAVAVASLAWMRS